MLLLSDTPVEQARDIAERIRNRIVCAALPAHGPRADGSTVAAA